MTFNQNLLLRSAIAIQDQLHPLTLVKSRLELPTATWDRCQSLLAQLRRAIDLSWLHSAAVMRHDLEQMLQQLQGEISIFNGRLEPLTHESPRASVRDIYADLVALYDEFTEVKINRKERSISVTTEPIVLEGIYLGPFEILLNWRDLGPGSSGSYRVIALDAYPAATNDSVTHPHVQDEGLCEGEGRKPIRKALEQGRVLDFFLIVANLLRTYNSGSPYVSLSDWNGSSCADCGTTVNSDDIYSCEKCNTQTCNDCYVSCSRCDGIYCGECTSRCEGCGERSCQSCFDVCQGCLAELCRNCLDENERCPDCHEKQEAAIQSTEAEAEFETCPSIQSDSLGQTPVPA